MRTIDYHLYLEMGMMQECGLKMFGVEVHGLKHNYNKDYFQ